MKTAERRYDIDWLRVIAIALLLIYHIAIVFQPWGVFIGFIQSNDSLESIWIPMSMLNVWRIPLLFFVSGMGVCFAMQKRSWKQLITERTRRILLPLVFGMCAIVPLHILIWQNYYNQDLAYQMGRGHLWFLANIFAYVIILLPLFYFLKNRYNSRTHKVLKSLFSNPFSILFVATPFIIEALVVAPDNFELYAMTWHGFYLGLIAFLFGYLFIYSGIVFWEMVLKWRWLYVSLALALFGIRLLVFELEAPGYFIAIESNLWVFSVFGFAHKHLNRPGKTLQYLSQAAYPIYIIHMVFIYLGSIVILPLEIHVTLKLILLIAFTFVGSYVLYELIIRRLSFVGVLFGLKPVFKNKKESIIHSEKALELT